MSTVIDAREQFKQRRLKAAESWDISHIYQHIKDQAARKLRASVLEKQSKEQI